MVSENAVTAVEPVLFGHRLLLLALFAMALPSLLHRAGERGRTFLVVWACLGITTAAPCLSAYLKPMGTWNNLGLIDLWLFIAVGPVLVARSMEPEGFERRARHALTAAFVLSLCPLKLPPTLPMYTYGEELDRAIAADVTAGRRVLLAHGTTPLIRAGVRAVPLDRANTALELGAGNHAELWNEMVDRFAQRAYDRIYLNSTWYGGAVLMISREYREVGRITTEDSLKALPLWFALLAGHDKLVAKIAIYEPKS